MHMLLGFLTVGALWVIGIGQAFFAGGSRSMALCAVAVGALTIVVGMMHPSVMVGQFHWIIQVIHLLLGILTIGVGHMAAARHRKVER
jgi:hypothetical protein